MPALSYFNVITWLAPKNVVVSNLVRHSFRSFSAALTDSSSLVLPLALGCSP